jgi:hypothetical protein
MCNKVTFRNAWEVRNQPASVWAVLHHARALALGVDPAALPTAQAQALGAGAKAGPGATQGLRWVLSAGWCSETAAQERGCGEAAGVGPGNGFLCATRWGRRANLEKGTPSSMQNVAICAPGFAVGCASSSGGVTRPPARPWRTGPSARVHARPTQWLSHVRGRYCLCRACGCCLRVTRV